MNIKKNIEELTHSLPQTCKLIAVSKTKPVEMIMEAYEGGQRRFGENKVQELVSKYESLPKDIEWHLIGHLQSNKVKYIASFVHLIHAVDSLKLLEEIDKQAQKASRIISCLLQVHIAEEETKFGLSVEELEHLMEDSRIEKLDHIKIIGLMGMATFTSNQLQIRKEFESLKKIFEQLKLKELPKNVSMEELSMGMSGDYKIAAEEGSTMVRIGSSIFGEREYPAQ